VSIDLQIRKQLRAADRVFELDIALASDSQRIVLYGPSGSGKSLTLKAIAGLMRRRGHIRLMAGCVRRRAGIDLRVQERNVAYLFQDYALFPHLTVAQNIAFGLARGSFNLRRPAQHPAVKWLQPSNWKPSPTAARRRFRRPAPAGGPGARPGGRARHAVAGRALLGLDLSLRQRMRQELADLQTRLQVPMLLITTRPMAGPGPDGFELRDGRFPGLDSQLVRTKTAGYGRKFRDHPASPRKDAGRRYITHIHCTRGSGRLLGLVIEELFIFGRTAGAVVDDWPCWIAWVTASK
jgi:molybdate transport system ATP-binding protein